MAELVRLRQNLTRFRWMGSWVAVYDSRSPDEGDTAGGNLLSSRRRKRGRRSKRGGQRRALVSATLTLSAAPYWGGVPALLSTAPRFYHEEWNSDLHWTPRVARAQQLVRFLEPPPPYTPGTAFSRSERLGFRFQRYLRKGASRIADLEKRRTRMRAGITDSDFRTGLRPIVGHYRNLVSIIRSRREVLERAIVARGRQDPLTASILVQSYVDEFMPSSRVEAIHSWMGYDTREEYMIDAVAEANAELMDPFGYNRPSTPPPVPSYRQARRPVHSGRRGRRGRRQ